MLPCGSVGKRVTTLSWHYGRSAPSCERPGMWVAPLDTGPGLHMQHLLIDTRHAVRRLYGQFREQLCEELHCANLTHNRHFARPCSSQR